MKKATRTFLLDGLNDFGIGAVFGFILLLLGRKGVVALSLVPLFLTGTIHLFDRFPVMFFIVFPILWSGVVGFLIGLLVRRKKRMMQPHVG